MGFYHIKNIKIDKKNNVISGELADSNWTPIEYTYYEDFCLGDTFEEKYANFIYNIVSGNYHPMASNKYDKIMMNSILHNYYQDAHDIGHLETYQKYKEVIDGILNNKPEKVVVLESDRTLNPEKYYVLHPIELEENNKYKNNGDFYINSKDELYCFMDNKLMYCDNEKNYGYPYYCVNDRDNLGDRFEKYNDFLKPTSNDYELTDKYTDELTQNSMEL